MKKWSNSWVFFSRTTLWTAILLTVPACAHLLGGPPHGGDWTAWEGFFLIASWVGLLLPFSAFSGGLAGYRVSSAWRLGFSALVISFLSLLLLGYASPHLQYQAEAGVGLDVGQRYPTGPVTVGGLSELRDRVRESPPEEFGFWVDRLLELPPNWITYRIHSIFVISLFALFAAFLGAQTAARTSGLPPLVRRNARWAIGLVSGVLFFVAEAMGGDWVRASQLNSGVLGAWIPLLVPLLELGLLYLLPRRSRRGSTVSQGFSSND